jgi:Oxoglutarate and iron-dependent oxygenase degradation C-term
LTALRPVGYRDELRRFRPGLDYTVAHHGAMTVTARLDATLCFVDDDRITLEDDEEEKDVDEKKENKKGLFVCSSFQLLHPLFYTICDRYRTLTVSVALLIL